MPINVEVNDWEKLETLKQELANVYKHAGYMASADVVKSYLERRVTQLQEKINLDERTTRTKRTNQHEYLGAVNGLSDDHDMLKKDIEKGTYKNEYNGD